MATAPLLEGTREYMLLKFYNEFINPLFLSKGYTLPNNVRISIGLTGSKNAIGVTFHPRVGSNFFHIYISPALAKNVYEVFATLIHEAIHTLFFDHLQGFSQCAAAVGLVKPWTSTTASVELDEKIVQWLTDNDLFWSEPPMYWGSYLDDGNKPGPGGIPGPKLGPGGRIGGPGPQKSRLIKLSCPDCNYIIRTSRANIDSKGYPVCPCGSTFEE